MLEVAVGRDADLVDLAASGRRLVEQRFDLLLLRVGELLTVAVEELDAVVLGRVVRRRDHAAEVEGQERDGGCRQHSRDDRASAGRGDAPREGIFELRAGCTRVAPDEDAAAAGPDRRGTAEPLDEISG